MHSDDVPPTLHFRLPSPLHEIAGDERLERAGVRLFAKRDDLIHPDFPGNKWRKLKDNVRAFRESGRSAVLTFGGAYSNHIQATAAAGYHFGFPTIGVIRGEEHRPLNPVLGKASAYGMRLSYVSRSAYRDKPHDGYGDVFVIPEGGANELGVAGCAEIPGEIDIPYDVLCCAAGTGTTLSGVASGLPDGARALGFAVLKGGEFLVDDVNRLHRSRGNWAVETAYHFGGFARRNGELDAFIAAFASRHGIALNWVYEAKMMYGLYDLIARRAFASGTTVVALLA